MKNVISIIAPKVQQYNSTTVQQYNSTTVQQYNSKFSRLNKDLLALLFMAIVFVIPLQAQINTSLSSENLSVTSPNPTCNTNNIDLSSSHILIYSGPSEAYTVVKELYKVGYGIVTTVGPIGSGNNPLPFTVNTNQQGNGTYYVVSKFYNIWGSFMASLTSNQVYLSFTTPTLSSTINNSSANTVNVCFSGDIIFKGNATGCTTTSRFVSITECTSGGTPIGTEYTYSYPILNSNANLKTLFASSGQSFIGNKYYRIRFMTYPGAPVALNKIIYIANSNSNFTIGNAYNGYTSYQNSPVTITYNCSDLIMNASSTSCATQYYIDIEESYANWNSTNGYGWEQWFSGAPPSNIGLQSLTGIYGPQQNANGNMNVPCYGNNVHRLVGGNIGNDPNFPRYYRVTLATNQSVWNSVTALVRIANDCPSANCPKSEEIVADLIPLQNDNSTLETITEGSNFNVKIYPNPLVSNMTIQLNTMMDMNMDLKIYDLNGKLIMNIFNKHKLLMGSHQVILTRDLFHSGGIYLLHATDGFQLITEKIIVM